MGTLTNPGLQLGVEGTPLIGGFSPEFAVFIINNNCLIKTPGGGLAARMGNAFARGSQGLLYRPWLALEMQRSM